MGEIKESISDKVVRHDISWEEGESRKTIVDIREKWRKS